MPKQERPGAAAAALHHFPALVLIVSVLVGSVVAFSLDARNGLLAQAIPLTLLSAALSLGVVIRRRGQRPALLIATADTRCRSRGR